MKKTREIILKYKDDFPEFDYYNNILDKIEKNIENMTDVSIESCKSLFEGISKTILKKFGKDYRENQRNINSTEDLFKMAIKEIPTNEIRDEQLLNNIATIIKRTQEIRNERGDISHGKYSPKNKDEISSPEFAKFIAGVTDASVSYLLTIYFSYDSSYLDIKYEDNEEFNDTLDDEIELEGICYSRALFDQDFTTYNERLSNFLAANDKLE